jgi:hypothetical protein
MRQILLVMAALLALVSGAAADTTVTAGDFVIERPTLLSLGFAWKISGDDNRNAAVAVTYRKGPTITIIPCRRALPAVC